MMVVFLQILALQLRPRSLIAMAPRTLALALPAAGLANSPACPSDLASNTRNLSCGGICSGFSGGRATFRARSSQHSGHPGTPHSRARSCADTQQRPFGSYGWHRRQCRHGAVKATPQSKVETCPARSFGGSLVSRFRGVAANLLSL